MTGKGYPSAISVGERLEKRGKVVPWIIRLKNLEGIVLETLGEIVAVRQGKSCPKASQRRTLVQC